MAPNAEDLASELNVYAPILVQTSAQFLWQEFLWHWLVHQLAAHHNALRLQVANTAIRCFHGCEAGQLLLVCILP